MLILEMSGEVSGFARVQEHEGAVFLREIYVRPDFRGAGGGYSSRPRREKQSARRGSAEGR